MSGILSDNCELISDLMEQFSVGNGMHFIAGKTKERILRYKAMLSLANDEELEAIQLLTESHASSLAFSTSTVLERYPDLVKSELISMKPQCAHKTASESVEIMLNRIAQMPSEWTLVQLTSKFDSRVNINYDQERLITTNFYITVFNCGQRQIKPFCIEINAPIDAISDKHMEFKQILSEILKDSRNVLEENSKKKRFKDVDEKRQYYDTRKEINYRLDSLIRNLQEFYIKEWRVLLIGKYENIDLNKKIQQKTKAFLKSQGKNNVSAKTKCIIECLVRGFHHLQIKELTSAVNYLFPKENSFQSSLKLFIRSVAEELNLANQRRLPTILILDEELDMYPWEMLNVCLQESVSRTPSLSLTYSLFKQHQQTIKNGFKMVKSPVEGRFVLNPSCNLPRSQNRMSSFFDFWTPAWKGIVARAPSEEEYKNLLKEASIFAYCGHGSGSEFLRSEKVQKMKLDTIVLLFGCSSSKLLRLGLHSEMYAPFQMYLTAGSPCVLGMLWEVTDLEADVLTAEFLSKWIPSQRNQSWASIDKTAWNKGLVQVNFAEQDKCGAIAINEPELLKALAIAKKSDNMCFDLTSISTVARGIPVKIQTD